jgi:hypothetical protein
MKKSGLIFTAILFLLAACGSAAEAPETQVVTELIEITEDPPEAAPPQDILGEWHLDQALSTFGGPPMLDPLEVEVVQAIILEITDDYLIFGDFGHTYSWIDADRIRMDGVVVGFGSVTDGFFYVFTVQHDGGILRLLTSDGTPFAVFRRPGSEAVPAIEVAFSAPAEATATIPPLASTPWVPCEGGSETHLFVGGYAYVNPIPPEPNIVRLAPDATSPQTGLIQPNELVEVLDGPQCSGGWVWWEVLSVKARLRGWTAEGDGESYWVLPCPVGESECGSP